MDREFTLRHLAHAADDYDAFDGEHDVGRIYRVTDRADSKWFWGVSFDVIRRKAYGYADSLDEAKAAFRAEYLGGRSSDAEI